MALTRTERAAGRAFLSGWRAELASRPPAAPCSPYVREARHDCPARGGVSVPVHLREQYQASGEYFAVTDPHCAVEAFPPEQAPGGVAGVTVPGGKFAVFWKEGACPACRLAFRSSLSRLFLAADRPPAERRAVR